MQERIYLVSDIHANLPALEAVLAFIDKLDPNPEIYSLGDDVGYGPYPKETLDVLIERGIESIVGNHDYPIANKGIIPNVSERKKELIQGIVNWSHDILKDAGKKYLDHLNSYSYRPSISLEFGNRNIILSHGSPEHGTDFRYVLDTDDEAELFKWMQEQKTEYDICVVGHTHKQVLSEERYGQLPEKEGEPQTYLNPLEYALNKRNAKDLLLNTMWKVVQGEGFSTYRYKLDKNKKYIINPGSVGKTMDGVIPDDPQARASFAYLEKDNDELSVVFVKVDYDIIRLIKKFKEIGPPVFSEMYMVDYMKGK